MLIFLLKTVLETIFTRIDDLKIKRCESKNYVITTVYSVLLRTYLNICKTLSEEITLSLRGLEKSLKNMAIGFSNKTYLKK